MQYLINDNVPEYLALSGKTVKTKEAVDDTEFFALLKKKLLDDVERIFKNKSVDDKMRAVADIRIDIEPLIERLESKSAKAFPEILEDRKERIGGLTKRLVMSDDKEEEVVAPARVNSNNTKQLVSEYGEKHNYPDMILKSKNNTPYKTLGRGKKAWDAALGWADLEWPMNENFIDLVTAVKNDARYDGRYDGS